MNNTEKINLKNIRYFNYIKVVDGGKNIVKSYVGEDEYYKNKFFDEIVWLLKAKKFFPNNIPNIVDFSLEKDNLWVKYNIIKYNTVHDFFVNEKKLNWKKIFESYVDLINKQKKIKPRVFIEQEWKYKLIDFYLERTINNIKKIEHNKELKKFFQYDSININNSRYPSLKIVINFLSNKIKNIKNNTISHNDLFYKLITPKKDRIFFTHLDLIFGNVFFDEKNNLIKIIDPRGSFADSKEYGDIYYDYAKVYQSLYGLYDFIVEDKFGISYTDENNIFYEVYEPKNINEIRKVFSNFYSKSDEKIIKLLESLQFFAMLPAHKDNLSRQSVQICTGIKHLYEVMGDEIWKY